MDKLLDSVHNYYMVLFNSYHNFVYADVYNNYLYLCNTKKINHDLQSIHSKTLNIYKSLSILSDFMASGILTMAVV